MAEIKIENVVKRFGDFVAVDKANLTIAEREFVVLLGPSGCGKTTLLRAVAGLGMADEGRISIGGRDVTYLPPRDRNISMVFQSYAIFPHMKVYDNIAFGLKMRKAEDQEIKRRVNRAAEMMHIEKMLDRFPSKMSGGQRQRVAVARAIAMDAEVLLMDEPLSNLDALLRLEMRAELKRLLHELNATTIYVTHDQIEALSMGDRIAVMKDGIIQQIDEPTKVY
ncbi:MAG: sugar ABC transporter ATP-binding protein, partial [Candidatus Promineifilaceae bacterium]